MSEYNAKFNKRTHKLNREKAFLQLEGWAIDDDGFLVNQEEEHLKKKIKEQFMSREQVREFYKSLGL